MEHYTLVIIDMQKKFGTAGYIHLNRHIENKIKEAISLNCHIVFVRYREFGLTNKNLTSLTSGYKRVHSVIKDEDDGSDALEDKFLSKRIPSDNLVVCGVNTTYCVSGTIIGLLDGNSARKITVPVKCCNSPGNYFTNKKDLPRGQRNPFYRLKDRNVKIV